MFVDVQITWRTRVNQRGTVSNYLNSRNRISSSPAALPHLNVSINPHNSVSLPMISLPVVLGLQQLFLYDRVYEIKENHSYNLLQIVISIVIASVEIFNMKCRCDFLIMMSADCRQFNIRVRLQRK